MRREQHNLLAGTSDLVPRTPGIEYPGCRYPVLRTSQHVPRTADPDIRHTVPRTSYPYLVTRTPFPTTSYLVRRASKKEEPRSNNGTYHDGASLVGGAFEGGLDTLSTAFRSLGVFRLFGHRSSCQMRRDPRANEEGKFSGLSGCTRSAKHHHSCIRNSKSRSKLQLWHALAAVAKLRLRLSSVQHARRKGLPVQADLKMVRFRRQKKSRHPK